MGRDVTLYPKRASREQLSEYLKGLGFEKCEHFWDWPKGTLNYFWFDCTDFKSMDGVSADVYPASKDELNITGNKWAIHVRNLFSASWYDVKMFNDVLKGARKEFGGIIKGDYGTNRYAPLSKDKSTPISRGLTFIYQRVEQRISEIKISLPGSCIKQIPSAGGKIDDFIEFTNSRDPSRVIYNGLVPFAVSMFEYFFSQAFQVLIAYDAFALERRSSHKLKIEFSTMLELHGRKRTIESIVAEGYTFQNLDQLNKAYKEWLNMDVRAILYKKKKIGGSIKWLENRIFEIIQYRHGIIHHFNIDRSLTKEKYIHILEVIELSINEFINFVEKKYTIKIER